MTTGGDAPGDERNHFKRGGGFYRVRPQQRKTCSSQLSARAFEINARARPPAASFVAAQRLRARAPLGRAARPRRRSSRSRLAPPAAVVVRDVRAHPVLRGRRPVLLVGVSRGRRTARRPRRHARADARPRRSSPRERDRGHARLPAPRRTPRRRPRRGRVRARGQPARGDAPDEPEPRRARLPRPPGAPPPERGRSRADVQRHLLDAPRPRGRASPSARGGRRSAARTPRSSRRSSPSSAARRANRRERPAPRREAPRRGGEPGTRRDDRRARARSATRAARDARPRERAQAPRARTAQARPRARAPQGAPRRAVRGGFETRRSVPRRRIRRRPDPHPRPLGGRGASALAPGASSSSRRVAPVRLFPPRRVRRQSRPPGRRRARGRGPRALPRHLHGAPPEHDGGVRGEAPRDDAREGPPRRARRRRRPGGARRASVLGFADGDGDPTKGSKAEEGTKGSEDPAAASTSPGRVFASPSFAARARRRRRSSGRRTAEVARASSSSAAEAFERLRPGVSVLGRPPPAAEDARAALLAVEAPIGARGRGRGRLRRRENRTRGSSSPPRASDPSSERDDFGSVSDDLRDPHPSGGDAPLARDPPASPTEIAVRWHEREHARLLEVLEREKTLATTTAKSSPTASSRVEPRTRRGVVGGRGRAFVEVDPGSDDEEPGSDDEGLRREFGAEAEAEARRLRWGDPDPDPDPARAADEGLGTRDEGRGTRDEGLASPAATRRAKFLADEEARRRRIDAEEEERGGTGDGERERGARAGGGEPGSILSSRAAPSSPASPLDALLARHLRLGRDRAELARGPPRGKGDWLERRRRRRENEGASERGREGER